MIAYSIEGEQLPLLLFLGVGGEVPDEGHTRRSAGPWKVSVDKGERCMNASQYKIIFKS